MALLTPTGYPFKCNINPGNYSVILNSKYIYRGKAYSFPGESKVSLDLSSIMRNYVNCPDYSSHFNNTKVKETNGQVYNTTLVDSSNTMFDAKFVWNYSPKSANLLNADYVISDYPTPWVYPTQRVCYSVIGYRDVDYSVDLETESTSFMYVEFPGSSSGTIDVRSFSYTVSDSFITDKEDTKTTLKFKKSNETNTLCSLSLKGCIPENAYTIYYINLKGGLSFVHCTGKNIVKSSISRNQITHEPDYSNTALHSQTNYLNQRTRAWTLNTPLLSNNSSKMLQDLFSSPMVWVHSYADGITTAAVVTDTSVEEKNKLNNRLFNYTINLKESQTYSILI